MKQPILLFYLGVLTAILVSSNAGRYPRTLDRTEFNKTKEEVTLPKQDVLDLITTTLNPTGRVTKLAKTEANHVIESTTEPSGEQLQKIPEDVPSHVDLKYERKVSLKEDGPQVEMNYENTNTNLSDIISYMLNQSTTSSSLVREVTMSHSTYEQSSSVTYSDENDSTHEYDPPAKNARKNLAGKKKKKEAITVPMQWSTDTPFKTDALDDFHSTRNNSLIKIEPNNSLDISVTTISNKDTISQSGSIVIDNVNNEQNRSTKKPRMTFSVKKSAVINDTSPTISDSLKMDTARNTVPVLMWEKPHTTESGEQIIQTTSVPKTLLTKPNLEFKNKIGLNIIAKSTNSTNFTDIKDISTDITEHPVSLKDHKSIKWQQEDSDFKVPPTSSAWVPLVTLKSVGSNKVVRKPAMSTEKPSTVLMGSVKGFIPWSTRLQRSSTTPISTINLKDDVTVSPKATTNSDSETSPSWENIKISSSETSSTEAFFGTTSSMDDSTETEYEETDMMSDEPSSTVGGEGNITTNNDNNITTVTTTESVYVSPTTTDSSDMTFNSSNSDIVHLDMNKTINDLKEMFLQTNTSKNIEVIKENKTVAEESKESTVTMKDDLFGIKESDGEQLNKKPNNVTGTVVKNSQGMKDVKIENKQNNKERSNERSKNATGIILENNQETKQDEIENEQNEKDRTNETPNNATGSKIENNYDLNITDYILRTSQDKSVISESINTTQGIEDIDDDDKIDDIDVLEDNNPIEEGEVESKKETTHFKSTPQTTTLVSESEEEHENDDLDAVDEVLLKTKHFQPVQIPIIPGLNETTVHNKTDTRVELPELSATEVVPESQDKYEWYNVSVEDVQKPTTRSGVDEVPFVPEIEPVTNTTIYVVTSTEIPVTHTSTVTTEFTTTVKYCSWEENPPPVSSIEGYVNLILETSWADLCSKKEQLRSAVVNVYDRKLDHCQVLFMNLDPSRCINPTSTENVISVILYLVDANGKYDESLVSQFDQGRLQSPFKVLQVKTAEHRLSAVADDDNIVILVTFSCLLGVVFAVGIVFLIIRKRRKKFNYGQRCTPVSLDDYSLDNISVYNSVRRKGAFRASKRSYGNPAFDDPGAPSHAVNFAGLANLCNNREALDEEFAQIPVISVKLDELPAGAETKNRYANVIPLPETRVQLCLKEGADVLDEYINANYVKGPKGANKFYIACQAPLATTVTDFWRMVWQEQCKVVLMLTGLQENGVDKCADYLPPSQVIDCHCLFGDFQITLKKHEIREKYIVSSLQLKNLESNSWREVIHLWYTSWPVTGVPEESHSLISYLLEAHSYMRNSTGPTVVHCSPGTGRTGTVLAIDLCIREFESNRSVDIPKTVYALRRDRAGAVQTRDQYAFIYQTLNLYATKLTGGALDSI